MSRVGFSRSIPETGDPITDIGHLIKPSAVAARLAGILRSTKMAPQSPRSGLVETLTIGTDRDTIVALGGASREHTVAHVD
jgi:hypothetical protein